MRARTTPPFRGCVTALERTPVVAVAAADQAGGAEAARRFGNDNHYLEYSEMLAREQPDAGRCARHSRLASQASPNSSRI